MPFIASIGDILLASMAARPKALDTSSIQPAHSSPLPYTLSDLDGALTLLQHIGAGSYGKVFLGQTAEGKLRAAKCIPLRSAAALANDDTATVATPESEAAMLRRVKHPNVIRLYDSKILDGRLWISMEYARYGCISDYLQIESRKNLTEAELATVAKSILRALKYIHKRGVIHRDVKPSNILVTRDGKVKLGDMGTACFSAARRNSVQGTFQYLAPEIFKVQRYDSKVDIWSFGMTILELAQGFNPFQNEHFARVLFHLVDAPTAPTLEDLSNHSNRFIEFLNKCLTLNAAQRPTAAELLKHPFLKKPAKSLPIHSASSQNGRHGWRFSASLLTNSPVITPSSSMSSAASDSLSSTSSNDSEVFTSHPEDDITLISPNRPNKASNGMPFDSVAAAANPTATAVPFLA